MIKLFRSLVILSFVVYAVFFFIPDIELYIYGEETLNALTWSGIGSYLPANDYYGYLFIAAYLVAAIGLFYFHPWARSLFMSLTLLSIIFTGIQGIVVLPPIEGVLSYITNLVDGATIIIMYFTSVSSRFKKSA